MNESQSTNHLPLYTEKKWKFRFFKHTLFVGGRTNLKKFFKGSWGIRYDWGDVDFLGELCLIHFTRGIHFYFPWGGYFLGFELIYKVDGIWK